MARLATMAVKTKTARVVKMSTVAKMSRVAKKFK